MGFKKYYLFIPTQELLRPMFYKDFFDSASCDGVDGVLRGVWPAMWPTVILNCPTSISQLRGRRPWGNVFFVTICEVIK